MIRIRDVAAAMTVTAGITGFNVCWAAPANADPVTCAAVADNGVTVTVCDGPVYPDGSFLRCVDVRNDVQYAWACQAMAVPTTRV